jgi:Ala-tRNA(Pro) deacylase
LLDRLVPVDKLDFYISADGAQLAIPMGTKQSDDLLKYLEDNGIAAKTFEHPPVHTVEESRTLRGDISGVHTKNLFLRDGKKRYFLFVTDEGKSVNLKSLGRIIGAKGGLSFGSAEALMDMLGITAGSVSLLAAFNDTEQKVTFVIDEGLLTAALINCHPLTNRRTTSLTKENIAAFMKATAHTPMYVSLHEDVGNA